MALLAQGKGVAVAKNVVITDNYSFENANNATLQSGANDATALTS